MSDTTRGQIDNLSTGDGYLIEYKHGKSEVLSGCVLGAFRFMEENNGEPYPDLMQLHFFELTKFIEQEKEYEIDGNDRMVKWLRFMTNTDDTRWEEMAKQEPIISKAVEKLKTASLDPEARMKYEAREKALKDMASIRGDGLREGRIEGRIEGKQEGKQEGKLEVAKRLFARGMDIGEIKELTGLSYTILKDLQEE